MLALFCSLFVDDDSPMHFLAIFYDVRVPSLIYHMQYWCFLLLSIIMTAWIHDSTASMLYQHYQNSFSISKNQLHIVETLTRQSWQDYIERLRQTNTPSMTIWQVVKEYLRKQIHNLTRYSLLSWYLQILDFSVWQFPDIYCHITSSPSHTIRNCVFLSPS